MVLLADDGRLYCWNWGACGNMHACSPQLLEGRHLEHMNVVDVSCGDGHLACVTGRCWIKQMHSLIVTLSLLCSLAATHLLCGPRSYVLLGFCCKQLKAGFSPTDGATEDRGGAARSSNHTRLTSTKRAIVMSLLCPLCLLACTDGSWIVCIPRSLQRSR